MSTRPGFTIIELLMVLLIMAVATAVTVPALLSEPVETELGAATRLIEDLFRTARDSAVRAGIPVTVTIDSASGGVWLIGAAAPADTTAASERAPVAERPGAGAGGPLELPPGVRLQLSRARATFAFTPDGAVFADSLLLRAGTAERLVTIDAWTGHVIVQ